MQVLVRRGQAAGHRVERRGDALRGLAHRVLDVATGKAEVGQFPVGHTQQLSLGGPQLEVCLDRRHEAVIATAQPQQGVAKGICHEFGAGVARAQFNHLSVADGKTDLGDIVPPRRRSFAGQIFKHLDRLGH